MKKFLLAIIACLFVIVAISAISSNAKASNSSEEKATVVSLNEDYRYVGNFQFYKGEGKYSHSVFNKPQEVYESRTSCGLYYVKVFSTYYKLFSCQNGNYNYYVAYDGTKYYCKI